MGTHEGVDILKRVISVVLLLAVLCSSNLFAVYASAEFGDATVIGSGDCGVDAHWQFFDDGNLIIFGTGAMENYRSLANWGCTSPWYDDYGTRIRNVTIQEGITTIGKAAFANCYYLETATIPNSVTRIEADAFYGIYDLTQIYIPAAVNYIGQQAFSMCRGLTSIIVDEGNSTYCSDTEGVLYSKDKIYCFFRPITHRQITLSTLIQQRLQTMLFMIANAVVTWCCLMAC